MEKNQGKWLRNRRPQNEVEDVEQAKAPRKVLALRRTDPERTADVT